MNIWLRHITLRNKVSQVGAAAVEMAIVFPLLFAVTYATIVYGYVFYIQQSINRIAEEALRSAVRIDPVPSGYGARLDAAANASIAASTAVTPIIGKEQIMPTVGISAGPGGVGMVYTVQLVLPISALTSTAFPVVNLPTIGTFPPLPVNLTATAVAQVN